MAPNLAQQLIRVTRQISEDDGGLVKAPGSDPDIKTKELSAVEPDKNNVTGKGKSDGYAMDYEPEAVDPDDVEALEGESENLPEGELDGAGASAEPA